MHGILSYEERVRLERANGIRPANECAPCSDNCHLDEDEQLKGKTYDELGDTLQPMNKVCPHTKVIVPVTPVVIVKDAVKEITVDYRPEDYRVVDFNQCDGRTGVLHTIPEGSNIKHASTEVTVKKVVKDTLFDHAHEVTAVTSDIKDEGNVEQPLAVNGQPVVKEESTENGKDLVNYSEAGQEEDI